MRICAYILSGHLLFYSSVPYVIEKERDCTGSGGGGRLRGEITCYYAKAAGGARCEMRRYFLREFRARTGIIL